MCLHTSQLTINGGIDTSPLTKIAVEYSIDRERFDLRWARIAIAVGGVETILYLSI